MLIKKGDIVRVLFPNSNLVSSKRRPALVIQEDNLNTGLPQTILAMISSNMNRANHPSRITVALQSSQGIASGLRLDSVIMTDNLVTVLDSEIDSVLGNLTDMKEVENALRHTFGLQTIIEENEQSN
ncbi:MAG: type II toxin-antitoxin system PemK/MazF family toxin [Actinomycetota bacterium]